MEEKEGESVGRQAMVLMFQKTIETGFKAGWSGKFSFWRWESRILSCERVDEGWENERVCLIEFWFVDKRLKLNS